MLHKLILEDMKNFLEHIEIYMNYIDKNIKEINENKTIGIIVRKENEFASGIL